MVSEQNWDLNSSFFFFYYYHVFVYVRTCTCMCLHVHVCAHAHAHMNVCVLVFIHGAQMEISEQPWVSVPRHILQDLLVCKFAA